MTDKILEVRGLTKTYGGVKKRGAKKADPTLDVLKGVDMTVHKGEVVSLIGPSGSGKTTLLRCANFLDQAEDGTMVLDGQTYHLGHVRRTEMYEARRHTAFVFQNYNLFLNKTALQNVTGEQRKNGSKACGGHFEIEEVADEFPVIRMDTGIVLEASQDPYGAMYYTVYNEDFSELYYRSERFAYPENDGTYYVVIDTAWGDKNHYFSTEHGFTLVIENSN